MALCFTEAMIDTIKGNYKAKNYRRSQSITNFERLTDSPTLLQETRQYFPLANAAA
jgi:hypothetical protein